MPFDINFKWPCLDVNCLSLVSLFQTQLYNSFSTVCHVLFKYCFKVRDLLERLSAVLGMEDCQGLFGAYTKPTIASLKDEYSVWTQHSVERLVFDTLLMHSG